MVIPTIDEIVLQTLDFFAANPPPKLTLSSYSMPFVVGSGNALNIGKILFSDAAAIFADESNFRSVVDAYMPVVRKGLIKDAVVISSSGEKDSTWEVEFAKSLKLKTTLLTCKPKSSAASIADTVITYKSIAEPYTYNTSTYIGMILSSTQENPVTIKQWIGSLTLPANFTQYTSYAFVLPDKFINVGPMIIIKDDELFGPHLMIRACAEGRARHAKFVHRWDKELVISMGVENKYFGDPNHRWHIALPEWVSYGALVSLSYYLCGILQKAKPDYFVRDIAQFCADYGPKAYAKTGEFSVIVPANE